MTRRAGRKAPLGKLAEKKKPSRTGPRLKDMSDEERKAYRKQRREARKAGRRTGTPIRGKQQELPYAAKHAPVLNEDRTEWLDEDGNPPKVDSTATAYLPYPGSGVLLEPFIIRSYESSTGKLMKAEKFMPGCTLPCPPGWLNKWAVAKMKEEEKKHLTEEEQQLLEFFRPRGGYYHGGTAETISAGTPRRSTSEGGGRRGRRWTDEDLTPEQLAKREARRARRAARKARRATALGG